MKKHFSKTVSVLLALSIILCLSSTAFASEETEPETSGTSVGVIDEVNPEISETDSQDSEAPVSAETPFRISNSVNGDTATQRGLCWYTKSDTDSLVEISGSDDIKIDYAEVFEWEGNYVHKALLSNLTAGTEYTYTVGSRNARSSEGRFRTDDKDSDVKFIAIADVQAGNEENMRKGANTLLAGLSVMPDADFYTNLGDFTNESNNEEWDIYDSEFTKINLNTTIAPVTGNHDGFNRAYWFNNYFNLDTSESVTVKNGVNYSFDYGNAHFAVVNTNDIISISLSQLRWLKNDMNSTDKDWRIVLIHKSPYTLGKDGKWPDALYLQKSLTKVLDACDVDLVLSGHDHQYIRTKALKNNKVSEDGTVYVLAGTAGSKRYEIRPFLAGLFMNTDFIDALNIQKNEEYCNYWNGENWDSTRLSNIGGCFNTIDISGDTLSFNSYILSDTIMAEEGQLAFTDGRLISNADSFTITKETGKNAATFSGDNTTSEAAYALGFLPSFGVFAAYTLIEWLPKFFINLPNLLYVLIKFDIF